MMFRKIRYLLLFFIYYQIFLHENSTFKSVSSSLHPRSLSTKEELAGKSILTKRILTPEIYSSRQYLNKKFRPAKGHHLQFHQEKGSGQDLRHATYNVHTTSSTRLLLSI